MLDSLERSTSTRMVIAVVVAIIVTASIVANVFLLCGGGFRPGPGPDPVSPSDESFAPVGAQYGQTLPATCAAAWAYGADELERGDEPIAKILGEVAKLWEKRRKDSFDEIVSPKFDSIVPESTKDTEISRSRRRELARAWRGFALGLNGGTPPRIPPGLITLDTHREEKKPEPIPTPPVHAKPVDFWRVRPENPRIEDLGHYEHGQFYSTSSRWAQKQE